ncbi:MAG: hypothetical protein AAFY72_09965 [Cyanobacteria bacterium J06649_4]
MSDDVDRLNAEWLSLNAFRGLSKIATQGDMFKSSYDNALQLGGEMYPELLGEDVSLLRRAQESAMTQEYREKARLSSIRDEKTVEALELLKEDIYEYEELLSIAEKDKDNKQKANRLKNKLEQLYRSKKELDPEEHSENQLIFRDAYNVKRVIPTLSTGHGHRDFKLPNKKVMRLRVLHPDKVEHITGADLLYERHSPEEEKVAIVAVQYKIWEKRKMYLSDERMLGQIEKMRQLLCNRQVCEADIENHGYRFPYCSAFLRPTDKLQKPDQKLMSTGEHLPICKIDECKSFGRRGAAILKYTDIKDISLSGEMFEFLFNKGKIGSKDMTYEEISEIYDAFLVEHLHERVVVYAQEFDE